MKLHETPLSGLFVIETNPVDDPRGRFARIFCAAELAELRPEMTFPQINLSVTTQRGTVRGMHFQYPPVAEAKLIRCLRGRVFDVAVDLRVDSPTYLSWHGVELSEDGQKQNFIPEGFAHGFQALSDNVQLLYMHTAPWSRGSEGRLRYDDPRLAIRWPLTVTQASENDRNAPLLDNSFRGVQL